MSDTTSDSENADTSDSVGRFTENIEEVFYVSLPILPSTTFACHICSKTAQNLKTHNGLKKTFQNPPQFGHCAIRVSYLQVRATWS